jgi:hypothetical protein
LQLATNPDGSCDDATDDERDEQECRDRHEGRRLGGLARKRKGRGAGYPQHSDQGDDHIIERDSFVARPNEAPNHRRRISDYTGAGASIRGSVQVRHNEKPETEDQDGKRGHERIAIAGSVWQ